MKRKNSKKTRNIKNDERRAMKYIKNIAFSVAVGTLVCAGLLFGLSFILTIQDIPHKLFSYLSTFACGVGTLVGGFTASKLIKEKGLLVGLAVGGIIAALLCVIGALFQGLEIGIFMYIRTAVTVLCGTFGGVLGVNIKKKRKI